MHTLILIFLFVVKQCTIILDYALQMKWLFVKMILFIFYLNFTVKREIGLLLSVEEFIEEVDSDGNIFVILWFFVGIERGCIIILRVCIFIIIICCRQE